MNRRHSHHTQPQSRLGLLEAQLLRALPAALPEGDHELTDHLLNQAIAVDRVSSNAMPLGDLWTQLISGVVRVEQTFSTDERHYAVFGLAEGRAPRPNATRDIGCLERVLLGEPQKSAAYAAGVSVSTLHARLVVCLSDMGVDRHVARLPIFLALLPHAAKGTAYLRAGRLSTLDRQFVVSVPRPDTAFDSLLSPAQASVARLLVDGKSHAQIAASRGSSIRTVANHLAAVFQRLRVSCRLDLICCLLQNGHDLRSRARGDLVHARQQATSFGLHLG